jgi:hypothetical protein
MIAIGGFQVSHRDANMPMLANAPKLFYDSSRTA